MLGIGFGGFPGLVLLRGLCELAWSDSGILWLRLWVVVSFGLGLNCGYRSGFVCIMVAVRLFWFGCFYVIALGLIVVL